MSEPKEKTICLFDLSDLEEGVDVSTIDIQVQLRNGAFQKVVEIDVGSLNFNIFHPLFKVCIKGNLEQ